MDIRVKGSIVALITPFNEDGSVALDRLGELIEWHIASKTDAILVLGTTGESSTMTDEEDNMVCEYTVKKVAGRVPVIAGSGSNCTQTMLDKSLSYQKLGADGLLLISPYYNKTNTEGMYRHFSTVADAVDIPCILYNVPGRTGCAIPLSVLERLSRHPNVAGLKEASGDLSYAVKAARYLSDDFVMYSGNDDIIVPLMSMGAYGVISVLANVVPAETHELTARFHAGDCAGARALQLQYLELINNLFIEVNPIPVKTAVKLLGKDIGRLRQPLWEMSAENEAKLRSAMESVGLL